MFRHHGKRRTFKHNLRLASNLSFIAGIVNIVGVLSVATLTTNVTGHFAFFAQELIRKNYSKAIIFILYILSFLFGAFVSNLLVEITSRIKPKIAHTAPMAIEILILTFVGLFYGFFSSSAGKEMYIPFYLLFAMGLQNALVTQISQATVRTTHLTGLFTDLGIELSQLFFYKAAPEMEKLSRSIYLRLSIICFFFIGGLIGGFCYKNLGFKTLFIASLGLIIALFYDNIRFHYYHAKRKAIKH